MACAGFLDGRNAGNGLGISAVSHQISGEAAGRGFLLGANDLAGHSRKKRDREQEREFDQAAPLTCSSTWMSPFFTAWTKALITTGSKRVPAKPTIFSTTYFSSMAF